MSTKSSAAQVGRELRIYVLRLISNGTAVPDEHKSRLYYLQRYGYVTHRKDGLALSPKGAHLLHEESVWSLTIEKPSVWDKKWRMVLFDIPKDKLKRRDAFRLRLKELGLVLYQQSVWVYPYPLEETIRKIAAFYRLARCISFVTADEISGAEKLKEHFRLT